MLHLYRRHLASCGRRKRVAACSCPIWVQGRLHNRVIRKSLGIRNWEAAQKIVRTWEARTDAVLVSVREALERYLADCEGRHLRSETLRKYRLMQRELVAEFGDRPLDAVGIDELSKYREGWALAAGTARTKIGVLRAFFRFCVDRGWIEKNPALLLKHPRSVQKPTLPVDDADFKKLLDATERFPVGGAYKEKTGERIKAFLLVLRYSGLRIGDVVTLRRKHLADGKLFLRTQKTGVAVWVPIPDSVVGELEKWDGEYFFWSGQGLVKTAMGNWQRSLARLGKIAGVKFHPHQLRDSFAIGLLRSGLSIEDVAVLLGHADIKITQKHYAPWVKVRQERLEEAVRRAWSG